MRGRLLIVLVLATCAGSAAAATAVGWTPKIKIFDHWAVWVGVEHQVGPATPQPVQRGSFGVGGPAGIFVGRGWRTAPTAGGMYTLTALDGAVIPYWLPGLGISGAILVALRRRKRRRVMTGFEVRVDHPAAPAPRAVALID